MAEIRYANLVSSPTVQSVSTMGVQYGPGGGDGWTQLGSMDPSYMPSGAGRYAIIVRGKVGNLAIVGTGAARGMVQVCLGTAGGAKLPRFRFVLPVTDQVPIGHGVTFEFLVFIDSTYTDTALGSSFDPDATELCLYARTFWNGDPTTYAASFDVVDVTWMWFDLANIPAGHWNADREEPALPTTLPSAPPSAFSRLAPTASGGTGETWLHFTNVWYEPRQEINAAPLFRMGVTPDGTFGAFVPRLGRAGKWGMRRYPSGTANLFEKPQLHHGGFFVHVNANGTTKVGYDSYEGLTVTARTQMRRWSYFGVRIDTLPDVRVLSHTTPQTLGVSLANPAWFDTYLSIERPAPNPGILTEPIVMLQGTMQFFGGIRKGYDAYLLENAGGSSPIGVGGAATQTDWSLQEGVCSIGVGRRIFQTTSPAMQWRAMFIGSLDASSSPQTCHDFQFVQFHPVRDPENLNDPPGTIPDPIVLVPGSQSADAGSLAAPPFTPNSTPGERSTNERPAISGVGYRRSWPAGASALRQFSVDWTLSLTDGETMLAWLRSHPAWRYTPPRSSPLAVLCVSNPRLDPVGHRAVNVSVDVAVLVWTGA